MANPSGTASVTSSLQIVVNGVRIYQNTPTTYSPNIAGYNGPTPGAVSVGVNHTEPSLTQLTAMGGLCRLTNLDTTNFVEWGIYDSVAGVFIGIGELLPGETIIIRLSRYLGKELAPGTGTAIIGHAVKFSLKADISPCIVIIDAFDP
jgi:hypothetical protein